ncbi:uncharacterized protein V1518DRAFT_408553 [Limtongia smithiae]|uniref:uncharacterized protein n=1 Tax=Limtongia smithiae TaxID=1125753 RepID=UPI0034D020A3
MVLVDNRNAPLPLTEENLQALLLALSNTTMSDSHRTASVAVHGETSRRRHPQHPQRQRHQQRDVDSDVGFDDLVSVTSDTNTAMSSSTILSREAPSTVYSTPQGSVVNFSARRAAAHLSIMERRPVQGTRQRRRLENSRMLYNPHAVPPTPQDYLPAPTYAVRRIDRNLTEYLASRTRVSEDFLDSFYTKQLMRKQGMRDSQRIIPRTLKERVKKGHLTQPFLKKLEEDVREFVRSAPGGDTAIPTAATKDLDVPDRDVLAAAALKRAGVQLMSVSVNNTPRLSATEAAGNCKQKFLLEKNIDIAEDTIKAEAFSRWIVYQIAEYYRIECYTKIVDERKVPCVIMSIDETKPSGGLPRPIWTII